MDGWVRVDVFTAPPAGVSSIALWLIVELILMVHHFQHEPVNIPEEYLYLNIAVPCVLQC